MEITYHVSGDYLIPDIILNEPSIELVKTLGMCGQLRQKYLQEHRSITYSKLLLSERLYPHLREVDEIAKKRKQRGVSEEII
ncbi:MAG: TnpV protein, partial [Oscillospiraceae bacterium]|nr:TnpV protein [Oscillospiraceae bacterium]